MSLRLASVAMVLTLSADAGFAADSTDAASAESEPTGEAQRLTPAQLRAQKESLSREIRVKREENAETRQFIEVLEQHNAELAAKKAELDARLADIQERLSRLEAAQQD